MSQRSAPVIVLVDSPSWIRAHWGATLQRSGCDVVEAEPTLALDALRAARPDIVVVNFNARTRSRGLTFCRLVKADRPAHDTTLLLTASAVTMEDVRLATAAGALVVASDPDMPLKLAAAINGVLSARRAADARPLPRTIAAECWVAPRAAAFGEPAPRRMPVSRLVQGDAPAALR